MVQYAADFPNAVLNAIRERESVRLENSRNSIRQNEAHKDAMLLVYKRCQFGKLPFT